MKIDIERCQRAMNNLAIKGTPRAALIEEAIKSIQESPDTAMQEMYFGIKNYASFGDQREDHNYNMGPRHGHIVFSIGRTSLIRGEGEAVTLGEDEIYLLECIRDFGSVEGVRKQSFGEPPRHNLPEVITMWERAQTEADKYHGAICEADVQPTGA